MTNHWFTADLHLSHKNIIKYCKRPFGSVGEMNKTIVGNLEDCLKKGDKLYVLGDLSFKKNIAKKFFQTFSDVCIIYLYGNHDNTRIRNVVKRYANLFSHLEHVKIKDNYIVLCHYPMRSWKLKKNGSWQLHGHSHGACDEYPRQFDVGVDTNDFKPYSYLELKEILDRHVTNSFDCESNEERR